jgi:ubiquinone/menaquinone biosynthesis C-methylase UbiE
MMSNSEPRRDPKGTEFEYLATVPLSFEDRVLDIGCGDGRLTQYFDKGANLVIGMDTNHERIREAQVVLKREYQAKQFLMTSRAEAIPFAEQTFSIVIFSWSL